MDELMPRQSIGHIANSKLLAKFDDKNWKVRKEGLDLVEETLAGAGNRILPDGLDDVMKAIG
jgi:cytoskeleton-associated protein 5